MIYGGRFYEETRAHRAARFTRAANRLLDRAPIFNGRGPAMREAGWNLLTRASYLHPWPVCWYARKPAPILPKLVVPKAEREALKAVKAARKAYDKGSMRFPFGEQSQQQIALHELYLDAVEHYCAVCGMEYKRPERVA